MACTPGTFSLGKIIEKGEKDYDPPLPGLGWVCVEMGLKTPEKYWMRMVQPYASKKFGFAFYPELGDQVLVLRMGDGQFLCLGSIYTKENKAKVTPEVKDKYGKNFIKEIRTAAGNAIIINDEKDKEYIYIEVKEGAMSLKMDMGGKSISIDGGDKCETFDVTAEKADLTVKTKNASFLIGKAKIVIKDDKLDVKAAKVTILSDGDITVKATGKVVIKGSQVAIC